MSRGKRHIFLLMLLCMTFMSAVTARAEWKSSSGSYAWYDSNGTKKTSEWVSSKNAGLVWSGSSIYAYKKNGDAYKGFITSSSGKIFFSDKTGTVLKDKWISLKSGGKTNTYRSKKDGSLYTSTTARIGSYYYGFDRKGRRLYGKQKIGSSYYYFNKSNGRMIRKSHIVSGSSRYYAKSNGKLAVKEWVGRYYFGSTGKALKNGWVGDRYLGSDGKYLTGLKRIGSYYYYFNTSNGKKIVSQSKTVSGYTFTFDSNGRASMDLNVEDSYFTDPKVSDETLLAAIIYCESGNQPYYGQLAVGLVITNRVRSSDFPSTIKGVVYADQQFEPARTGVLTNLLKNPSGISDSCKKAAKEVMTMYKNNKYTIKISSKKSLNMQGYYFFMTPAAYQRLGLSSTYVKLEGHVFFKNWSR